MTELVLKIIKKKFEKNRKSFAQRYRHCNHCEKHLNIDMDEELIYVLCGKTSSDSTIIGHFLTKFSLC